MPDDKREIPRMTEEEIKSTVLGLVRGNIFTASQLPQQENLSVHFLPLIAGWGDTDTAFVGNVIANMADAMEMAVNGYPCFARCRIVHTEDWAVIAERALKVQEAIDAAVEQSP